ncbi:MAG: hypothetical protein QNK36_08615 [Colwellia sp.]|nr:hypothetical protein [Colwellia sp.]
MYKHIIVLLALINVSYAEQSTIVHDEPFYQGTKQISLFDNKGKRLSIGSINFSTQEKIIHYQINLEHKVFTDYFLSMKEMKCLEGPELWCHLAYPYDSPRNITETDFSWLSHDLLFMYKKNSEFGANFNNGIYYDFKLESGRLIGTAMALDLNLLAAPPEDKTNPPITVHDIDEIELTNRWLPTIEIK